MIEVLPRAPAANAVERHLFAPGQTLRAEGEAISHAESLFYENSK